MIQNNETDGINDTDNIIKTHELPDATLNLWVILFIVAMFFTVTCYAYLYCWQMDYYQRHRPPVAQQQLIVALDRRRENEEIEETAV
ncbi:hypothetical protein X777_12544 [Ooceraea biroi]|uniref:Uncharacterized protein n=1 Tax=Ooceraea biroi TaxID=2015173 RepID=A0A026W0M8_OOCBI|nr:hypothetical protein X777_12544 [Ooceraea biroi]